MPDPSFSMKKNRIIIIGIVLLTIGAVYRFFPDVQNLSANTPEIEIKKAKIVKLQKKVASREHIQRRLNNSRRVLKRAEKGLLKGETTAIAAVEMQRLINEAVQGAGVEVKSVKVLKTTESKDTAYISVPVQFSMVSSIQQLSKVLYKLESLPKIVKITHLKARVRGKTNNSPINSTITVEGLTERPKG